MKRIFNLKDGGHQFSGRILAQLAIIICSVSEDDVIFRARLLGYRQACLSSNAHMNTLTQNCTHTSLDFLY